MDSNFAPALRQHLESLPTPGLMERRALRILNAPDSPRRQHLLARWEHASRDELGMDQFSVIDWFKENWVTILQVVLSVLGFLLLFAAEPGPMMAGPEEAGWFPGKQLLLSILPQLIDQIGLPWAREMSGRFPIPINYNDADLKTFLLDTFNKSQP